MIVWGVIIVWSVLAGIVAGCTAFAAARDDNSYPVALAHGHAGAALGALSTSVLLVGFAWALGLL